MVKTFSILGWDFLGNGRRYVAKPFSLERQITSLTPIGYSRNYPYICHSGKYCPLEAIAIPENKQAGIYCNEYPAKCQTTVTIPTSFGK